ncbi:MAG: hypothetical protein HN472_10770 [Nitrospina sp.]|jgi:hypothetical protein|nr:hypothetical protein [Nitrospina sp.]MBT3877254.1 hypothetical protein [Nitrospina sp.]MBT4046875.1 hypothetical protein [Nitrospina sp.]MBT4557403.1 hypothetical protein [Nitrospina sp.]MBT5350044.1 hypothetical protein [Nitrospina sp.]
MGNSGLENFLLIATKPDNIPIGTMLIFVGWVFWVAVAQMIKHDKWIKEGKKEKVWDEMIK